ncbi:Single-stranded-DNA-specific exonuclease RecJ [Patescibacteria group bacterium]|nr:Single-stranded-DNA-specific exonuclease RecJ [Patescibacteria group bacterium]
MTDSKKLIVQRPLSKKLALFSHLHPVIARIYAARGVQSLDELDKSLTKLPSPWLLSGMDDMVNHLVQAIQQQQRISIVADYDADGATSCAVAVKGLQLLGFQNVAFVVPNRFEYGYGLTPEIVELVKQQQPDVIITVDNGISSIEGVKAAKLNGIKVLVTDHHLPPAELPKADAIVNPNLADDKFPSGALAGVGVMFYVLMALRSRLRELGEFQQKTEPNLAQLLDYVALGTVADVVPLDSINRILVHNGLKRIREGKAHLGLNALIDVASKHPNSLNTSDLGFSIAPRLNAAGRMDDMAIGINCLLTDDVKLAKDSAIRLDEFNQERREVENNMKQQALAYLADMKPLDERHLMAGVCLYDDRWHQGVIGILASRIKDKVHRPVIAFAPAGDDEIKGSARSIEGVHIRDVLSDIASTYPHILSKFGGHAMAAGLSLKRREFPAFVLAFDEMVAKHLKDLDLQQKIYSDGELDESDFTVEFADLLQQAGPWGQSFPEPMFHGVFDVVQVRILKQKHLKLVIRQPDGRLLIDAVYFFVDHPENWLGIRQITAAYKLDINEYRGQRNIQFILQYLEKII